jgi:hypothetical protein
MTGKIVKEQNYFFRGTYSAFFIFMFLPVIIAHAGQKLTGSTFMIARNTNDSGGRRFSSPNFNLNAAVGETRISSSTGIGINLYPGYVKLASQPGSVISITAVTKTTGTLQLNWTSPGADGFEGGIINGFYRVDYSSETTHTFSPTAYKLEFSTSVEANTQQFLTINGLQPDTTYYTKIYLSDSQKFFSEDSRRSDESTLANIPADPVFSRVDPCDVTITWALPSGGSQGYEMQASSTNFGVLYPGGLVSITSTSDGLQLNLALTGLTPATTYFFKVASLNWQGNKNFTTIIGTVTRPGVCDAQCVTNLSAALNPWSHGVTLTWGNPSMPDPEGVLIVLSTNPSTNEVSNYKSFTPGQILNDSSLVKNTDADTEFIDSGLTLNTTYFYHLFAQYVGLIYSVSVSTSVYLDLPPMAPAGLTSSVSVDRSSMTINWKPATSSRDGTLFLSTDSPRSVELTHYRIDRSSSILNANWIKITTVSVSALSYTDDVPDPNQTYLYRISGEDSIGTIDSCMAVDTDNNLYAFASDKVTRLKIPPGLSNELISGFNSENADVFICATEEPSDPTKNIFSSVRFNAVQSPGNIILKHFQFSKPEIAVFLKYQVSGGQVVPSGMQKASGNIHASVAASNLGIYWDNTDKFVKLFGHVDTQNQTISVKSAMTGTYQIRSWLRESGTSFDISGLSNRVITPNGDGLNDTAVFNFDNPKKSGYSGKIFDIEGAFVADMSQGPVDDSLKWDGKRDGQKVQGGVYVYQIRAEGKVFNGTLMVIR